MQETGLAQGDRHRCRRQTPEDSVKQRRPACPFLKRCPARLNNPVWRVAVARVPASGRRRPAGHQPQPVLPSRGPPLPSRPEAHYRVTSVERIPFAPATRAWNIAKSTLLTATNTTAPRPGAMAVYDTKPPPRPLFSNIIGCWPWAWHGPFKSGDGDRHPQVPNLAHRASILWPDNKGAGWCHREGVRRGRILS